MPYGDAVVNRLQLVFVALCSSLVGFSIGNFIVRKYDSEAFHPWTWKQPPFVVNCYGEDLQEAYIVEAIHYWTIRNEKFAFIEQNPSKEVCENDFIHGFILIKKKDLHYNVLGSTVRKVFMGNIVSSVIYFDEGTYRMDNVVIHEIGHAMGYNHVELDGHIMHPLWDKMTDKFWIPE
jgi:hypothetical protein